MVGVLTVLAQIFYLYWTVWWSDTLLHFLSGVCVSIGGISAWFIVFDKKEINLSNILIIGVVWVIFIGVIWEIFELSFSLTFFSDGAVYLRDTVSDLIVDISGGLVGAIYANKLLTD